MPLEVVDIISAVGTILLMIAVFVGAYYVSKLVGKRYSITGSAGVSKRVKVLESTAVGKDSSVIVIRAGEKVLLIGATPKELTFLSELDAESFPDIPEDNKPRQSFRSVLRSVMPGKNSGSGEGEDI